MEATGSFYKHTILPKSELLRRFPQPQYDQKMCRPTPCDPKRQNQSRRLACHSLHFFNQYPDFKLEPGMRLGPAFSKLATQMQWKANSKDRVYEKAWKECMGPYVPVGNFFAIDDWCPHLLLDKHWGTEWMPEDGVRFEEYFYRLAAEKGWERGMKAEYLQGPFELYWRECFGPNVSLPSMEEVETKTKRFEIRMQGREMAEEEEEEASEDDEKTRAWNEIEEMQKYPDWASTFVRRTSVELEKVQQRARERQMRRMERAAERLRLDDDDD